MKQYHPEAEKFRDAIGKLPDIKKEVEPNQIDLNQIDSSIKEGKWLMAAVSIITTTSHRDKTPMEVMGIVDRLSKKMFGEKEVENV